MSTHSTHRLTRMPTSSSLLRLGLGIGLALSTGSLVAAERVAAAAEAPAAASGPTATLKRLNGNVDKLLRAKTTPGTAEDKRVKDEVKQRASELLDYTELCKRALGDHWGKMPEKQRVEFVETLQQLIERNYVRQLRTNLDYAVTYEDESIDGGEAKVKTTIKLATRGKATDALIEYRFIKKEDGRWMVYDVVTDELSLVRNYRSQFQRIIAGSGYDGLLNKMKSKLAEEKDKDGPDKDKAEKDKKDPAAAASAPAQAPSPSPSKPQDKAAPAAKPAPKPAAPR